MNPEDLEHGIDRDFSVLGGTGGLGRQVVKILEEEHAMEVASLSSKDIELMSPIGSAHKASRAPVFINLSGLSGAKKLTDMATSEVHQQLVVNALGPTLLYRELIEIYLKNKVPARFINVSSIMSELASPGTSVYSATKAYGETLFSCLAKEYGRYGMRFNTIQLGYFEGGMTNRVPEAFLEEQKKKIPTRRFGTADEIVKTILYIDETPYLNGAVIPLHGGII